MKLSDRLERLDPRERRLLGVFVVVLSVGLILAIPVGAAALVSSRRGDNEALRDAVTQIQNDRVLVQRSAATRQAVLQRYASPAPPLAGLLEGWAKGANLEIPESQDRPLVPHGKEYDERATKIVLRKVGMLNLARFLEKIQQSPHPVTVERINIRKRGTEADSYDVDMNVSAYDRKAKEPKTSDTGEPATPGEGQ